MGQSQGSGQQQLQKQNTNNLNDLMGLEFGTTNPATIQGGNVPDTQQQSANMANFLDDTPQTQPQTQAQPQPQKKVYNGNFLSIIDYRRIFGVLIW